MKQNLPGSFVISLDFELQYGIEDHDEKYIKKYRRNRLGSREVIEKILFLFKKYEIHATWAIVGMMLAKNRSELRQLIPDITPKYNGKKLSIYSYLERLGNDESDDPFHYGLSVARKIQAVEGQEIGTHTFSHYYCCYPGQDETTMRVDMETAQSVSIQHLGVKPVTVVFPRNQVNKLYIPLLRQMGILAYRGCPLPYIYNVTNGNRWVRAQRLFDSYFSIYGTKTYTYDEISEEGIVNCKASNFFRPYSRQLRFMEQAKLAQIKGGILDAAMNRKIYHLWWHPHNFGIYQRNNLDNLERVLAWFQQLKREYGILSMSMKELAEQCIVGA